jgi:uncharacterized membrane protein YqaE (UPF0057 family)
MPCWRCSCFVCALTDIHLIFGTLLCHIPRYRSGSTLVSIHWFFTKLWPLDLEKYYKLSVFCTFVVPPTAVLQSGIVTNQNLVMLCLNYFGLNYTVGRGLGIACNALRMLMFWIDGTYSVISTPLIHIGRLSILASTFLKWFNFKISLYLVYYCFSLTLIDIALLSRII